VADQPLFLPDFPGWSSGQSARLVSGDTDQQEDQAVHGYLAE